MASKFFVPGIFFFASTERRTRPDCPVVARYFYAFTKCRAEARLQIFKYLLRQVLFVLAGQLPRSSRESLSPAINRFEVLSESE